MTDITTIEAFGPDGEPEEYDLAYEVERDIVDGRRVVKATIDTSDVYSHALRRAVTWQEVEERTDGQLCIHDIETTLEDEHEDAARVAREHRGVYRWLR